MKKIGIACDDYKLEKFKRELDSNGYKFDVIPFGKCLSVIQIHIEDCDFNKETLDEIKTICHNIEFHFHRSN